jgi:hypothetical protein
MNGNKAKTASTRTRRIAVWLNEGNQNSPAGELDAGLRQPEQEGDDQVLDDAAVRGLLLRLAPALGDGGAGGEEEELSSLVLLVV